MPSIVPQLQSCPSFTYTLSQLPPVAAHEQLPQLRRSLTPRCHDSLVEPAGQALSPFRSPQTLALPMRGTHARPGSHPPPALSAVHSFMLVDHVGACGRATPLALHVLGDGVTVTRHATGVSMLCASPTG